MLNKDTVSTIKMNTAGFSFLSVLADHVGNNKFKTGYSNILDKKSNDKTFIWEVLSSIGEDVTDTLYSNVLNYIDLASNIDICKIKALHSMIQMEGIDYSIFTGIDNMPIDILDIMNIMSIKRHYLLNSNVVSKKLIDTLSSSILSTINNVIPSKLSCSRLNSYIDDDLFNSYLISTYYSILYENVMERYDDNDKSSPFIYNVISNDLLGKQNTSLSSDPFRLYKIQYNIPLSLDQESIVDNIDNGYDSYDNYSGYSLSLLIQEKNRRKEPYIVSDPITKYKYYKEKNVKEYFDFIENKIYNNKNIEYLSTAYSLDSNFVEVKLTDKKKLIDEGNGSLNTDMISSVAKSLAYTTIYISELRDKFKSQAQKNYMKGTFNLLSYVINEYLNEFANQQKFIDMDESLSSVFNKIETVRNNLKKHIIDDIGITEYDDVTEYFNISTDTTSESKNSAYANDRYWENFDKSTNSGFAFSASQIEEYYLSTLNMKNEVGNLDSFLSTIYSIGADRSYISKTSNELIIPDCQTSSISSYHYNIALTYGGLSTCYFPYYNHKNVTHPSYQIHPYLYNFIEHISYNYPVANTFYSDITLALEDKLVESKLSNYIGKYGQTIDIWLNNAYDYSGYRTRYEACTHTKINVVDDYDGAFYKAAVEEFLLDPESAISSISCMVTTSDNSTFFEKYYANLALTDEEYKKIALQLKANEDLIADRAGNKSSLSNVYDIYKYGLDKYDNAYILYKKYNSSSPSYKDKENTPGDLWIRLKDHPIAFPALYGSFPAIDVNLTKINGKFANIAKSHVISSDDLSMSYFYDMEFDKYRRSLYLIDYPINDNLDHNISNLSTLSKSISNSDVIINEITYEYDSLAKYNILRLTSDKNAEIDCIDNPKLISDDTSPCYYYIGMYNTQTGTNFIFIEDFDLSAKSITSIIYVYNNGSKLSEIKSTLDFSSTLVNGYKFASKDIKANIYNNNITFAILISQQQSLSSSNIFNAMTDYPNRTLALSSKEDTTSFDSLDSSILIADGTLTDSKLTINSSSIYNLNADASYIPSYPGNIGKNNIWNSILYNSLKYNNIELLGNSYNSISAYIDYISKKYYSSDDPDADNSGLYIDFNLTYSNLSSSIYGRIFEDYVDLLGTDIIISSNPLLTDKNFAYDSSNHSLNFNVDVSSIDYKDLSGMMMIVYNSKTYGKNPYYIGKILSNDVMYVNYIAEDDNADVSSTSLNGMYVIGTYDIFSGKVNMDENNHLFNISSIYIYSKFDDNRKLSAINIECNLENENIATFIKAGELNAIIYNKTNLKEYEYYHYLDSTGKYKIGSLSAIELSNYLSLADVPCLSGENNLDFKFDEENNFKLSDRQYYFPGNNEAYPLQVIDLLESFGNINLSTSLSSENVLNGSFNSGNLFINQIETPKIIDKVGEIEFQLLHNIDDTSCMMAFEDYLSAKDMYSQEDPRVLEYIKFESEQGISEDPITCDYDMQLISSTMLDKYVETYLSDYQIATTEDSNDFLGNSFMTYVPSYNSDNISAFLNIYATYANTSNGIVLYFNYYNYLNSPFIKMVNGKVQMDIIKRTYLKLLPGENGDLDIVVQFKYYAQDGSLNAYKTVPLITYSIYNISDDKPKFLVFKKSEVIKNSYIYTTSEPCIDISAISKNIEIDELNNSPIEFNQEVILSSNMKLLSSSFTMIYDSDLVEFESIDPGFDVEKIADGYIGISAYEFGKYKKLNLKFKTLDDAIYITHGSNSYPFIIDSGYAVDYSMKEAKVLTYDGYASFYYDFILRQESNISTDYILTEDEKHIKIDPIVITATGLDVEGTSDTVIATNGMKKNEIINMDNN